MKYNDTRQEKVIKDILFTRNEEPKRIGRIVLKGMKSYFNALKTFGPFSPVTKETLKVIKDILKIQNINDKLLLFILENIDQFDISATENVVLKLEKLTDSTYDSYQAILNEINEACRENDETKELRPKDGISTLLTNNRYKTMVLGLGETFDDIKDFLPYSEDYWEFIKNHLKTLPTTGEGARIMCGVVPLMDDDGVLYDFYTIVPKVVDYETAMESIGVYKRAHDLFLCRGQKFEDLIKTNGSAAQIAYREHLEQKAKKTFR